MAFCDFAVKWDSSKETPEDLTSKILMSIFIKRLKAKKPVRIFIAGKSGEGKSYGAIRLEEMLCELQGIDIYKHFLAMNVLTPLEYGSKLNKILYDKELKKVNLICMHEAREIIKAKDWQSFLSTAVADVHAMSRTVKRLMFIIISQSIKNITREMRYTLDFYCTVSRPKRKATRLRIWVLYIDERDLEKPKLRKRKLTGYIIRPNGTWRRFVPEYLVLKLPDKSLTDQFEKADFEGKSYIIKNKLNKLISQLELDLGKEQKKVTTMVNFYLKNPDTIHLIGKRYRGKFKVKKEVREMHNLSKEESVHFEKLLNQKLEEKGVVEIDIQESSN